VGSGANLENKNKVWGKMKKIFFLFVIFLFLSAKATSAFEYTIVPSLSLTEEYNDNIFLDSSDKVDDFITYITPSLNLSMRSANSELAFGYSTSLSFYNSHSYLNGQPAHNFNAGSSFRLSERLSFTLSDTYVMSSETRDIRAISDTGPLTGRRKLTYNNISGNIFYKLGGNLTYTLGASYLYSKYEEPDETTSKIYSGTMGLTYRHSESTALSASAIYTQYDYKTESDAKGQNYTFGCTYVLTPTVTIGFTGGVSITKIEDTGESETGYIGGVNITKRLERGQASLSYEQRIINGIETETPVKSQILSLSLSRPFTNKFAASLSTSYGNYKSIETNETDTDEMTFTTSLTYRLRPWATLALSYNYVKSYDKKDDANAYDNNRVLLTLNLSYGREARK
jgi:hypothetical protein